MLIGVIGVHDQKLLLPLTQIARLFYQDAVVQLDQLESCHLVIDLTSTDMEKAQGKYHYLRLFLRALQQETGIIQKWGVLTGVRPTKLWHRQLQMGNTREEVAKQLQAQYLIQPEKLALLEQIGDKQLTVLPDFHNLNQAVSIYIGIPFCPTKCAYCTFPAYAIHGHRKQVDEFLNMLIREIQVIGQWLHEQQVPITTIYFGGGTPTSISAEQMDKLYQAVADYFPFSEQVREITVEAGRPDTLTEDRLEVLKKWKVDRISINPQSFHGPTLTAIGRHHPATETIEKFHLAREFGFDNINMDLIIGLPGENVQILEQTLAELSKLDPESITVHTLAFKRAAEMTLHKDKYPVADRMEAERMMNLARNWASSHNYAPYYLYRQKNILGNLENIGYAKPGYESIYNILIMEEIQTIIGLGCGAASKFVHSNGKITRYANPKDPKSYIEHSERYAEEKLALLNRLRKEML